jgi:hypothetical protein
MARTLLKAKGRNAVRLHIQVFRDVLDSPQYAALSSRAVKLLLDIHAQYRGHNNGDLCAAWSIMRQRGWRSKDQLRKGLDELLAAKFIAVSRQPRAKRQPTLYRLTFEAVNDCGGKLDIPSTAIAGNDWRTVEINSLPRRAGKTAPQGGSMKRAGQPKTNKKVPLCPAPRVNKLHSLPRSAGPFLDLPCGEHMLATNTST